MPAACDPWPGKRKAVVGVKADYNRWRGGLRKGRQGAEEGRPGGPPHRSAIIKETPLIDTIPDILARIVARKREELAGSVPTAWTRMGAPGRMRAAPAAAISARRCARACRPVIAEVKKASPSKGVLCADFDPARIARDYRARRRGGHLRAHRRKFLSRQPGATWKRARGGRRLPVLRKDFTIAPEHIVEAAAHGADAILLIAAILTERELRDFREAAARYGMAALVEVHNRRELDAAIAAGSDIIGVNNRNLDHFRGHARHFAAPGGTHARRACCA